MAHGRAWLKGLTIAVTVLCALALVLVVLAEPLIERVVERARADAQAQLGRPVALGDVEVEALRGQLQVSGVRIGPVEQEPDIPALTADALEVDVGIWRTLGSFGRRIAVERVELTNPTVNVVRRDDGTLNWGEISDRWQQQDAPREEAEPPRVHVTRGWLREGTIRFLDTEQSVDEAQATISKINGTVTDLSPAGGQIALEAAVLAPTPNLKLDLDVQDLDELPLLGALRTLTLELAPTSLEPLAPFGGALLAAEHTPEQGMASANVHFTQPMAALSRGIGEIRIEGVRFPDGQVFDGRVEFDVSADRNADELVVRQARLAAAELQLDARAKLSSLSDAPRVDDLELRSEALDFSRLQALYPPFRSLTQPVELAGPFSLRATGGGSQAAQQLELALVFTGATVRVRDVLEKPPGTAATITADLANQSDSLQLERGTLQLSNWQLAARGSAQRREGRLERYAFELSTPRPEVGGLLRLLPPIADTFPEAKRLDGELSIEAELEGTDDTSRTKGAIRLAGVDVRASDTRIAGGGSLQFDLRHEDAQPTGQLHLGLSELELIYLDVVDKPRGTPLELDIRVEQTGDGSRADFELDVASLAAAGNARLGDSKQRGSRSSRPFAAQISLEAFQLRPLMALLPTLAEQDVPDVRFGAMQVNAQGATGQPEALSLEIPSFVARAGRSDLRGSLQLENPDAPNVRFEGRSSYLDLDDFLPAAEQEEKQPSPLAQADGQLTLNVERGRAAQVPYQNLKAQLELEDGRARAEVLEVEAFGGRFSGTGSEFPVFAEAGPYHLQGSATAVQLAALLARFAGTDELMAGSLGASFDLRASDTTPRALGRSLTGHLRGNVGDARFIPGNLVSNFLDRLRALPNLEKVGAGGESLDSWQLGDLSGKLVFERGAVVIDEPLTAATPYGPLSLRGKLGLDGPADLAGTLRLRPDALQKLVGSELALEEPLPLEFTMTGSLDRPDFAIGNLESAIAPILRSQIKQSVGREAERSVRQAVRGILQGEAPSKDQPSEKRQDQDERHEKKQRPEEKQEEQPSLEDTLRRRMDELF